MFTQIIPIFYSFRILKANIFSFKFIIFILNKNKIIDCWVNEIYIEFKVFIQGFLSYWQARRMAHMGGPM